MSNKILIVLPNDSLGGAEQVLKMIANHQSKINIVNIYFLRKKSTNAWNDILINNNIKANYGRFRSEYLGLIFLFFFLLRPIKYHYLFTSHVLITGFLGFLRKIKIVNVKYFVGRESTSIFDRFSNGKLLLYKFMYFIGYDNLDLLICQTQYMEDGLRKNLPSIFRKIKVKTISNPIDLIKVKVKENIEFVEGVYIVSAGRLIQEKGFDILIHAFGILKNKYPLLKLIILGEGKKRLELERLIHTLNLQDNVLLPGFVDNVYPYFKKAKVCVVSSRVEGFPNVLLQMMSQNNRVVSTLCAGGIENIKGVYTSNTNDFVNLSNTIANALEDDVVKNRILFDEELNKRSIDNFMNLVEESLNEKIN